MFNTNEALTYKEFIERINRISNFSIVCNYGDISIFYDFDSDIYDKNKNYMRMPIFSVSTQKPYEITAPSGYRFVQFKAIPNLSKVEELAIKLSKTPLIFRGGF